MLIKASPLLSRKLGLSLQISSKLNKIIGLSCYIGQTHTILVVKTLRISLQHLLILLRPSGVVASEVVEDWNAWRIASTETLASFSLFDSFVNLRIGPDSANVIHSMKNWRW